MTVHDPELSLVATLSCARDVINNSPVLSLTVHSAQPPSGLVDWK